jgi:hypothetical protein
VHKENIEEYKISLAAHCAKRDPVKKVHDLIHASDNFVLLQI